MNAVTSKNLILTIYRAECGHWTCDLHGIRPTNPRLRFIGLHDSGIREARVLAEHTHSDSGVIEERNP